MSIFTRSIKCRIEKTATKLNHYEKRLREHDYETCSQRDHIKQKVLGKRKTLAKLCFAYLNRATV